MAAFAATRTEANRKSFDRKPFAAVSTTTARRRRPHRHGAVSNRPGQPRATGDADTVFRRERRAATLSENVRPPAVAAMFYPGDPAGLRTEVLRFLAAGAPPAAVAP
jgi:hypothetical protein